MSPTPSGLDDARQRAFAWRRFRRIFGWMALGGAFATLAIVWLLDRIYGGLTWVGIAASAGGVYLSILLAAALMGLTFLSSGSGHDETVHNGDGWR